MKVFGCIDVYSAKFVYKFDEVFNAATYLDFLDLMARRMFQKDRRIHYIQDNASYHKSEEVWEWFKENRKWIEVYNLPPYSPEFNAAEPLWKYTRKSGTHNKCFESKDEVEETLYEVFGRIKKDPGQIRGYLTPFQ